MRQADCKQNNTIATQGSTFYFYFAFRACRRQTSHAPKQRTLNKDPQTLDPQTLDPQTLDPQRQMGQMTVKRSGVPAFVFPEIPQIFCLGSFAVRV